MRAYDTSMSGSLGLGLYQLVSSYLGQAELTPESILAFIASSQPDDDMRSRLLSWIEEMQFWEEYARIYRNLEKARPYAGLAKVFEQLVEPQPGDVWLDVGCGPAKMSQLVWEKSRGQVQQIVAMDIVLSPARETLASMQSPLPLELIYASIGERLPFADCSFDGVVANLVLSYVTDFHGLCGVEAFANVMSEMQRVLKPGGKIVWSTPRQGVRFEWVFLASIPDMLNPIPYVVKKDVTRILQGVRILKHALEIQRKGREGIYTFLDRTELEELLESVGLMSMVWQKAFTNQVWVNCAQKLGGSPTTSKKADHQTTKSMPVSD
jgi:ubiquinone/menaquinone biosynthesis C-methylase UbiE